MRSNRSTGNLRGLDFDGVEQPLAEESAPLITPIKHNRLQDLASRLGFLRRDVSTTALSNAEAALPGQTDRVVLKTALRSSVGKTIDTARNANEGLVRPPGEGKV